MPAACTPACWARPTCAVCGQIKRPRGRSAPWLHDGCSRHCDGYEQDPKPGHLWPGEPAEFGTVGKGGTPDETEGE